MGISDMSNQLLGLQAGGLKTADKQALIDIANTADSSNTSVNTALTNVIGSPTVNGDGYAKIISDLNTQKSNLVTRLASRGVTAVATETLKALVDKISNIVYGGVCTANDIRTGKSAVVNGVLTSGTMNLTNLSAGNVKSGVVIDGVTGTYGSDMKKYASGTITSSSATASFTGANGSSGGYYYVDVTGLTFTPSKIIVYRTGASSEYNVYDSNFDFRYQAAASSVCRYLMIVGTGLNAVFQTGNAMIISSTEFKLPVNTNNVSYGWYAVE